LSGPAIVDRSFAWRPALADGEHSTGLPWSPRDQGQTSGRCSLHTYPFGVFMSNACIAF
jgi:hypothetical protein